MNQSELFEKRARQWQWLWRGLGLAMLFLSAVAALGWMALTVLNLLKMK